ncbi:MAG: DapH/DapD/GlmU-related protein [Kofleriaceae bacterium]
MISGKTVAGRDLVLVGGNCVGGRRPLEHGDIKIGDNVLLGANACILGPISIGDNVRIGAGAIVVHDTGNDEVVVAPVAAPTTIR